MVFTHGAERPNKKRILQMKLMPGVLNGDDGSTGVRRSSRLAGTDVDGGGVDVDNDDDDDDAFDWGDAPGDNVSPGEVQEQEHWWTGKIVSEQAAQGGGTEYLVAWDGRNPDGAPWPDE